MSLVGQTILASSSAQTSPTWTIIIIALEIIVVGAVLISIRRFTKGGNFFRILEAYIIIFGSFFFFFLILGNLPINIGILELAAVSFVLALGVFFAKNRKQWNTQLVRNVVTMISCIGAGAFLGVSLGIVSGVLVLYAILGLFAVYDYLAVFVLKFMIPFAKQAASMNLAFMIGSSEMELHPKSGGVKKSYTAEELAQINNSYVRGLIKQGGMPSVSSVMLGNGDIMLPMMVAVGAYVYTSNISLALAIIFGAALGLIATFWVLRKYKMGLPAIPPIFAFVSLAMAIFSVVTGAYGAVLDAIFVGAGVISIFAMYITVRRVTRINSAAVKKSGN